MRPGGRAGSAYALRCGARPGRPRVLGWAIVMRTLRRIVATAVSLTACAFTADCGEFSRQAGLAACPELSPNVDAFSASLSADARANGKVRAFVQASKDLASASVTLEAETAAACRRMGADLGLPPGTLAPRDEPGGQASGACLPVVARIDAILQGGAGVRVAVTPPSCQANAQADARCRASCQGEIDPGEIVARCEPGRLVGYCQGTCQGRCEGRCTGECRGQCSARDAQGRCVGSCAGDCNGACDAACHASCAGRWQAPRCEGSVRGPSADAECDASCRAHADVHASCSPALVSVQATQNTAEIARLAATLQANLPALLHAQIALARRLSADLRVVGQVGAQLPQIVGSAGAHALACVGAGAQAVGEASARVDVSFRASASVSGRVGAGG
jgi:hypothetical protein